MGHMRQIQAYYCPLKNHYLYVLHCQLQAQSQLQAQTGVDLILNDFEDFDMIWG